MDSLLLKVNLKRFPKSDKLKNIPKILKKKVGHPPEKNSKGHPPPVLKNRGTPPKTQRENPIFSPPSCGLKKGIARNCSPALEALGPRVG